MPRPSFLQTIRARGFRVTPQRLAILSVLDEAELHLAPSEIIHRAQEKLPGLTEVTVYRTLDFLAEQGLILCAHIGSGSVVYEIADHHHHMICRHCGLTVDVNHELVKPVYEKLEQESGYLLNTSHLTFFGVCPDCQKTYHLEA
ncbi:MAG: Fur family transcriptional regulator [Chloroflexota bacterium]